MRPSTDRETAEGSVFVLDTLPECRVVYDALREQIATEDVYQLNSDINELTSRFKDQTRTASLSMIANNQKHSSSSIEDEWRIEQDFENPRFQVREADTAFVLFAAHRILNQREVNKRLFNLVTRRTKAAHDIVFILSNWFLG
jgi:hypothetical protein